MALPFLIFVHGLILLISCAPILISAPTTNPFATHVNKRSEKDTKRFKQETTCQTHILSILAIYLRLAFPRLARPNGKHDLAFSNALESNSFTTLAVIKLSGHMQRIPPRNFSSRLAYPSHHCSDNPHFKP